MAVAKSATLPLILFLILLADGQQDPGCKTESEIGGGVILAETDKFTTADDCGKFCRNKVQGAKYFFWSKCDEKCVCKDGSGALAESTMNSDTVVSGSVDSYELICCRTLKLESAGPLRTSEQNHIIGTYLRNSNSEGWNNYRQVENFQKYIYYMSEYSRWFVGDAPGVNAAYAWCLDKSECPNQINGSNWEYFAYNSGGIWISDSDITITCQD